MRFNVLVVRDEIHITLAFRERFDFGDETRINLAFQGHLDIVIIGLEVCHTLGFSFFSWPWKPRIYFDPSEFVSVEEFVLPNSLLLDPCLIQPKLRNNANDLNFFTLENVP